MSRDPTFSTLTEQCETISKQLEEVRNILSHLVSLVAAQAAQAAQSAPAETDLDEVVSSR